MKCQNPNGCPREDTNSGDLGGEVRCPPCHQYRYLHGGEERPGWLIHHRAQASELIPSTVVTDISGLTYRQLDHGVRIGVFRPQVMARGSGTHRGFTEDDAAAAVVIKAMRDAFTGSNPDLEREVVESCAAGEPHYTAHVGPVRVEIDLDEARDIAAGRLSELQVAS